jgi:hypothetical protein
MNSTVIGLDHPEVIKLRTEFKNICTNAAGKGAEAMKAELIRKPALYWPSRMTAANRDRLIEIYMRAFDAEMQRRLPQLANIDHDLHALCAEWPLHSIEELLKRPDPPKVGGFG